MNLSSRLSLFILLLKLSTTLGATTREGKITGGYEAKPHSNPYVVSLQSRFLWLRFRLCTGSILSNQWILSAGHCVTDTWAQWLALDAIVGAHDLRKISESQIYSISHRIAHPLYRGEIGPYDIAMLKTSRKMEYSKTVQPISLPATNPEYNTNEGLLIAGWGALSTSSLFISEILPNKLQEVEVMYLPYKECYGAVDKIKDSSELNPLKEKANICTGPISGGIAGCTGDSGGPLVQYVPYSNEKVTTPAETASEKETTTAAKPTTFTMEPTTNLTALEQPTTTELTTMEQPTTTEAKTTEQATETSPTIEPTTIELPIIPSTITVAATSATTTLVSTSSEPTTKESTTLEQRDLTTMKCTSTEAAASSEIRKIFLYSPSASRARYGNSNRREINHLRALRTDMLPTVVGVLSWGVVPCGDIGAPTVYSNVTNYMDFIKTYLKS